RDPLVRGRAFPDVARDLDGLGKGIPAVEGAQNLARCSRKEDYALQVDEVEERGGGERDRDPVPQRLRADRRDASRSGVDRHAGEDREGGKEEDEVLLPEVKAHRRREE